MNRLRCLSLLLLLMMGTSALAEPQTDRCVILISVDGLAHFYLDDPRADLPTIRQLAAEGARAQGLECSFPTVTWPNHTSLVTGVPPARHGVLGNNYLDRETANSVQLIVDPLFDKDEIVKVPTVYDIAKQNGLTTAGILWPASRNAPTLDWTVPDMPGLVSWMQYGTREWLAELREAGIPIDDHERWCKEKSGGVQRDWLYTRMARHLFENHPPNLILVHLIEVDHVEHNAGPQTPDAYWAVSHADDRVRDIVEAARKSKFGDNLTIIVASDHGFFPIRHTINTNVRLRELGFISDVDGKPQYRAKALSQGGACMVYILDEEFRKPILDKLKTGLAVVEGVDRVITPEQFEEFGVAFPEDDPRAPDLWLSAREGYSFGDRDTGELISDRATPGGTHGYHQFQEALYGTLVISGAGVREGVDLGLVKSIDVAPTIAALLGLEMPTADGKPLEKALSE